MNVLLPAPLGPMIPIKCPSRATRSISHSTGLRCDRPRSCREPRAAGPPPVVVLREERSPSTFRGGYHRPFASLQAPDNLVDVVMDHARVGRGRRIDRAQRVGVELAS